MIQLGIPAFDEAQTLPATLLDLNRQTERNFTVWVFINQPDLGPPSHSNRESLAWIAENRIHLNYRLEVLDGTALDLRPPAKKAGIGWVRNTLWQWIGDSATDSALWVSGDADTFYDPDYLKCLRQRFAADDRLGAMACPFYHRLDPDPETARALVRYELFLRYYQCFLIWIGCPHALTALGSAMAFRSKAYQKAGGFPVRNAAEDFYLLQNLIKTGRVEGYLPVTVFPAGRISNRVPFGTGALLSEDKSVQDTRFPFYAPAAFDEIGAMIQAFSAWYDQPDALNPFPALAEWQPLREKWLAQHKTKERLLRACHERFDGLRLLQHLRASKERFPPLEPIVALNHLAQALGHGPQSGPANIDDWTLADLEPLRQTWFQIETEMRLIHHHTS